MQEKTKQLLAYILQSHKASVTSLMKLAYLIDLVNLRKENRVISNFNYIRYNFGPFDSKIYLYLEGMTNDGLITPLAEFTSSGSEFVNYELSEGAEIGFNLLSDVDRASIDEVLNQLDGYGARALTEVAYKTKPMIKLGATLGGNENLGKELDLHAR